MPKTFLGISANLSMAQLRVKNGAPVMIPCAEIIFISVEPEYGLVDGDVTIANKITTERIDFTTDRIAILIDGLKKLEIDLREMEKANAHESAKHTPAMDLRDS